MVAVLCGEHEGGAAVRIFAVDICTVLQQQTDAGGLAVPGGFVQRGAAVGIVRVDMGAGLKQEVCQAGVAPPGGDNERCFTPGIGGIGIGTGAQACFCPGEIAARHMPAEIGEVRIRRGDCRQAEEEAEA